MIAWIEMSGTRRRVEIPLGALHTDSTVFVDGGPSEVDARMIQEGVLSLVINGRQYRCVLDGDAVLVNGARIAFSLVDPRSLAAQQRGNAGAAGSRAVKAPMPGRVVRVLVAVGDAVQERQGLVAIEAMKMQNELKSPKAGTVSRVSVAVGDTVAAGDVMIVVE